MAGRRLNISSLLCADDQSPDRSQPAATQPHSPPYPSILSGPGVPPSDYRDVQAYDFGLHESQWDAPRSRTYTEYSRVSHDAVPLSLQPVHLRRHTPSPPVDDTVTHPTIRRDNDSGHSEILTSHSRPLLSPLNRDHDLASYHSSHHLPQAVPRPIPSSRRSSDPNRVEYRLFEGSSYFSPPLVSRGAQSDSLATSAYPPPPSHSSSHSPPQPSPLPSQPQNFRRPSQSPVLGLRPISSSPTNVYRPTSQSSNHSSSQGSAFPIPSSSYTQSPRVPPTPVSPIRESLSFHTPHRSMSFLQSDTPSTAPRPSAAALNNLLHAEPSRSPVPTMGTRGSPGGLGGLEALVQAATEERRRLSGEHPAPLEVGESARRVSLSPVLNRAPPPLPRPSQSPVLQRSPMLPSPRVDARVNSLAVISFGHDGEPPMKRRRRTGSFGSGAAATQPPVTPIAPPSKDPPPATSSLSSLPSSATPVVSQPAPPPAESVVNTPAGSRAKPTSISQLLSPEPPPQVPSFFSHAVPNILRPVSPVISAILPAPPVAAEVEEAATVEPQAPERAAEEAAKSAKSVSPAAEGHQRIATDIVKLIKVEEGPQTVQGVAKSRTPSPSPEQPEALAPTVNVEAKVVDDVPACSQETKAEESSVSATAAQTEVPLVSPVEAVAQLPELSTDMAEVEESAPPAAAMEVEELPTSSSEMVAMEGTAETEAGSYDDEGAHQLPSEVQGSECVREQDPHEWLLEHYADESPVHVSHRSSPGPEEPPQTPYFSDASPPPCEPAVEIPRPPTPPSRPLPETKRAARKAPSASRSPTPTALLEQELDDISANNDAMPKVPVSPRSDASTDLVLELDLAVSVTPDTGADPDVSMGNELDDELLSLLDDKPRHSHPHSYHAPSAKTSHSPPNLAHENVLPVKEPAPQKAATAAPPIRAPSTTPAPSERVVMPPPIAPPAQTAKPTTQQTLKADKAEGTSNSASMKKKELTVKPIPKPKQPKPKPKPAAKPKMKPVKEKEASAPGGRLTPSGSGTVMKGKKVAATSAAVTAAKRGVSAAAGPSRSRSTSEMPMPAEPASKPKPQPEEEEESEADAVDDKLYCVCKTSYDEDRVMIACDRCDEWYHTQCLNMNDLEVDLIDQFVCPICVKANPNLPLTTTYKQRCAAGLKHPHPSSPSACHKPARGAFSKFCSDECGIESMQRRIGGWGGDQAVLWASVRGAKQPEGVVIKVQVLGGTNGVVKDEQRNGAAAGHLLQQVHEVQRPTKTQRERVIARLQTELEKIAPKREEFKKELEVITWRQKLLRLAAARAERVDECGWDQRLCFDNEEYAEFAEGVLESYEESHAQSNGDGGDGMQVDAAEEGEWWCRGKKKCQRHAGWQKLRASEFEFDEELKEKSMSTLTTREREIRLELEDTISLPLRKTIVSAPRVQPSNGHHLSNGIKAKPNGTSGKKGKQKT